MYFTAEGKSHRYIPGFTSIFCISGFKIGQPSGEAGGVCDREETGHLYNEKLMKLRYNPRLKRYFEDIRRIRARLTHAYKEMLRS